MKTVYFVRHGESEGNKARVHQPPTESLSPTGAKQAQFVAKRLKNVPFDIIISSSMKRARETAHAIAKETGREIVESDLFREILPASAIWGKSVDDAEAKRVYQHHLDNFDDDAKRHSDEEKFSEFKKRSLAALSFLIARREEAVVVVTHGTMLAQLMTCMMCGEAVTSAEFLSLNKFFHASNTGITKCVIKDDRWRLWTWNDDAHLGEIRE